MPKILRRLSYVNVSQILMWWLVPSGSRHPLCHVLSSIGEIQWKSLVFGVKQIGYSPKCHLLAVGLWLCYLTFLILVSSPIKMEMKNTVRISLILRCIFFSHFNISELRMYLTIGRSHIIDMFSFFLRSL